MSVNAQIGRTVSLCMDSWFFLGSGVCFVICGAGGVARLRPHIQFQCMLAGFMGFDGHNTKFERPHEIAKARLKHRPDLLLLFR